MARQTIPHPQPKRSHKQTRPSRLGGLSNGGTAEMSEAFSLRKKTPAKRKTIKEIKEKQRQMIEKKSKVNERDISYQVGYYQALCWVLGQESI